jgi:hypothetical protein
MTRAACRLSQTIKFDDGSELVLVYNEYGLVVSPVELLGVHMDNSKIFEFVQKHARETYCKVKP